MISRLLRQQITYWNLSTAQTDAYGDKIATVPKVLLGRVEDRTELFIDAGGNQRQSRAIAYTTVPVITGGYLYLGQSTASNPQNVTGADMIRRVEKVPDLKGSESLFKIFL